MKKQFAILALAPAFVASAQEPSSPEIEALRRELLELKEHVGSLQKELKSQQARWEGYHAPATGVLAPLPKQGGGSASAEPAGALEALEAEVESLKAAREAAASRPGLFNPDISAAIDFISSWSREANNWNFTLRNVELVVQSEIDHLAKGIIVLNGETELSTHERLDPLEHANVVVEEAVIETTSLPWGLQLRAGQFFADFTRLGKVHGHDLPFVDRPLSLEQVIGGEAVARGFELNWVPPLPHYVRLTGGLVDNIGAETPSSGILYEGEEDGEHDHGGGHDHGGPALFEGGGARSFRSLTAYGRAATLFEVGENAVVRVGGDYAQTTANKHRAPNRRVASADVVLQWQPDPSRPSQFEVGGEALWSEQSGFIRHHFLEEAENGDVFARRAVRTSVAGGYAYAQYRIGKQWTPGVRVDYTRANRFGLEEEELSRFKQETWTYSGYLSLNLSEFNRLRLQLSYADSNRPLGAGLQQRDFQAFFQWTVFLGTHKHGFMP